MQATEIDPYRLSDDLEAKLAHQLLGRGADLDRNILHALLGRPKRYAELKPLLGGRRDHNLTVALKRLQQSGLVDRRTDARQKPIVHRYELTALGIQVVLAMQSVRPIQEQFEIWKRGRGKA